MKFEKLCSDFINSKKLFIKESTLYLYKYQINKYFLPYFKNIFIHRINQKLVEKFFLHLQENLKYSTYKNIEILFFKIIKYFINNKKCIFLKKQLLNLTAVPYKKNKIFNNHINKKEKIKFIEKKEQEKLISLCTQNFTCKNFGILLCLYTGIRIGECCALKWQDIDFVNETIIIEKTLQRIYVGEKNNKTKLILTEPKSKNSNREIPLPKVLIESIKKIKIQNNYYILSNSERPLEPRNFRKYYNLLCKKNNIQAGIFHNLRHTFASQAALVTQNYKLISEILGHSSLNTTMNYYIHSKIQEKRKIIDLSFDNEKSLFTNYNNIF